MSQVCLRIPGQFFFTVREEDETWVVNKGGVRVIYVTGHRVSLQSTSQHLLSAAIISSIVYISYIWPRGLDPKQARSKMVKEWYAISHDDQDAFFILRTTSLADPNHKNRTVRAPSRPPTYVQWCGSMVYRIHFGSNGWKGAPAVNKPHTMRYRRVQLDSKLAMPRNVFTSERLRNSTAHWNGILVWIFIIGHWDSEPGALIRFIVSRSSSWSPKRDTIESDRWNMDIKRLSSNSIASDSWIYIKFRVSRVRISLAWRNTHALFSYQRYYLCRSKPNSHHSNANPRYSAILSLNNAASWVSLPATHSTGIRLRQHQILEANLVTDLTLSYRNTSPWSFRTPDTVPTPIRCRGCQFTISAVNGVCLRNALGITPFSSAILATLQMAPFVWAL